MFVPRLSHRVLLNPSRPLASATSGLRADNALGSGFTLIETAVAAALITLFLSSLFLLNSLVLRMLRSGNEAATASYVLQARAEQIRMSNWLDVTSPGYLPNTLLPLSNQPKTAINLAALTETVSVGVYQFGAASQAAPSYIYQLTPAGSVVQTGGTGTALPSSDCVQFIITEHWSGWGGRVRERTLTTLASTWGIGQQ